MRRKLTLASAVLGLAVYVPAWALGLGQVQQRSALNEPLSARIPLSSVRADELESMVVELASAEAFRRVGMDRPFSLSRLNFEVVQNGGQPYIRVSSQQPIKEPFLSFLVEVSWNRGRMLREYTLLLDPPVYASGNAPAPSAAASAPSRSAPASTARRASSSASSGAAAQAGSSRQEGVREMAGGEVGSYTVQANDTLWRVANRVRPDRSVSVHQTMLALFRANPDAFISNDMNRLKRGSVLRVPVRDDIAALSGDQAQSAVQQQIARWRAGQAAAEGGAAQAGAGTKAAAPAQDSRLQIVAPAERSGTDAATALLDKDLAASRDNLQRLQQELSLTQEQNASLSAERDELEAQVGELRKEIEDLERLVNLQLQQGGEQPAEAAGAEQPVEAEAAAEPVAAEQPVPAEPEVQAQPVAEQAKPEPKPAPKPAAVAPTPQPSAVPDLWSDWRVQAGAAGGVLGLLAVLFLMFRRRRQATAASVELGKIETVDETAAAAEAEPEEAPAAEPPAAEAEAPAAAAAPSAGQEMPPESDVLSEAEVYLAYGRYDQARDVVAKAAGEEPQRRDLRVKLLEIMALMQDRAGFENEAQGLFGLVGDAADPDWQKVAQMGREIAPENPLFAGGDGAAAEQTPQAGEPVAEAPLAEPAEDDLVMDLDMPEEPAEAQQPAAEEPQAEADEAAALDDLEFDLGGFAEDSAEESAEAPAVEADNAEEPRGAAEDDFGLDFDLGGSDEAQAEPAPAEEPAAQAEDDDTLELTLDAEASQDEDDGFSFDLDDSFAADEDDGDLALAAAPADTAVAEAPAAAPAEAAAEEEALFEGDEVDTKLDLAQAYLDMGDADGARELLNEVVEEGSGAQKERAEALLAQL